MTSEQEAVAQANQNFYRAFETLKIEAMEQVWSREADIQCGHPGWRMLRGWGPVMESWKRIFENTPSMRFILTDVRIEVAGDVAWVTLYENLASSMEGQNYSAAILTTNMFQKSSGGWRMILHHGSPVSQSADLDESNTVH